PQELQNHLPTGKRRLLVCNCRAGWAGEMNYLETLEADLTAPLAEIGAGIVERVAEFDQHVQRHEQAEDVLPARVVDQSFEGDQRAAGRQGIVSRADEV